ncbi:MAG: hypothetical protein O6941_02705 [Planctomycetota bacterium]|nr:hypothetical protein [Planctomycetota bacterium]
MAEWLNPGRLERSRVIAQGEAPTPPEFDWPPNPMGSMLRWNPALKWSPAMALSVTDPIGAALGRTKRILFKPFDIRKWFVLGFCAFLAYLGKGGGGPPTGGSGGGGGGPSGAEITDWIKANLGVIIAVGLIVMFVMFVIGLLLLWVRSRGKFMLLDGVVHNRGEVVAPWKAFRLHGNSLFLFSFAIAFGMFVIVMLIVTFSVMLAWPDIQSSEFGSASISAIVIGLPLLFGAGIVYGIIAVLLEDFVVPTMYLHDAPVMPAWRIVRTEVLAGNLGTIILYFLMKIVLAIAIGVIGLIATCLTCCLAAIPYLGTVILLPLYVFTRCYPVCFLEQLGPSWKFFPPDPPEPEAPQAI